VRARDRKSWIGVKNGVARASFLGSRGGRWSTQRSRTEQREVRSLERRLPKSVTPRDAHVHLASWVVDPDALLGSLRTL